MKSINVAGVEIMSPEMDAFHDPSGLSVYDTVKRVMKKRYREALRTLQNTSVTDVRLRVVQGETIAIANLFRDFSLIAKGGKNIEEEVKEIEEEEDYEAIISEVE